MSLYMLHGDSILGLDPELIIVTDIPPWSIIMVMLMNYPELTNRIFY